MQSYIFNTIHSISFSLIPFGLCILLLTFLALERLQGYSQGHTPYHHIPALFIQNEKEKKKENKNQAMTSVSRWFSQWFQRLPSFPFKNKLRNWSMSIFGGMHIFIFFIIYLYIYRERLVYRLYTSVVAVYFQAPGVAFHTNFPCPYIIAMAEQRD